ncbi:MAG: GTPase Era [Arsenophonus endosymbiont of Ceratovacuna japonica]
MSKQKTYCGFVSIIGRPNVGKSTLINQLVGKKISITSRKPQTTQHRIMGIQTKDNYQIIYIDTPGLHLKEKHSINRLMNKVAKNSIYNVELIIFIVDGTYWTIDDEMIINKLRNLSYMVLLVINKIDNIIDKTNLLPHIDFLNKKMNFLDIILISAKKGTYINFITNIVCKYIPEATHYFPSYYITNRSQRFMATEIVREKLINFLGNELPYSVSVDIEQFMVDQYGYYNINIFILVVKNSQKKIIISKNGNKIKKIGIKSRIDMERFFDTKVNLKLWVKVKTKLVDKNRILNNLDCMNSFIY